jgi:hypothetical protein
MKIRPVEAELFHADRQRDTTKLILAFHNSANAPKKTQIKFRQTAVTIKSKIFKISGLKILQFCLSVYNGAQVNLPASEKITN